MNDHIRFHHHSIAQIAGDHLPLSRMRQLRPELPNALREHARVLGPTPKRALAALADLGMSDSEIARYHRLPRQCVSELRNIWNIAGEV